MTDDQLESALSAWFKETAPPSHSAEVSARSVLDRLGEVRQRAVGPAQVTARRAVDWRLSRVAAIGLVASAVIVVAVALGSGSLGPWEGTTQLAPGASGTSDADAKAVHWRSDVIDLRADSVELRIGDEVFTGTEVDVVDSSGYTGQFMLRPMWVDDARTIWLYLYFVSDDGSWAVEGPWLWLDGLIRADDEEAAQRADGLEPEIEPVTYGDNVDFDQADWIGMPLGEAFEGDWQLDGRLEVPTCESPRLETVDVALTFENMRLEVTPREPTFIEQLGHDWFHRGSMLGDLVRGEVPRPEPRVLDCPAPEDVPEPTVAPTPSS